MRDNRLQWSIACDEMMVNIAGSWIAERHDSPMMARFSVTSAHVLISPERKQAELDHQRQNMELARVGRVALMGELAASLAHEVNNPIGAMVTNANAGQRLIARGKVETEELNDLLADIVADGHRAREVIQGIRNMVRKGRGCTFSCPTIKEIIQDLLRIVHADAMAKRVRLVTEIDSNAASVVADRVQLLQVLAQSDDECI